VQLALFEPIAGSVAQQQCRVEIVGGALPVFGLLAAALTAAGLAACGALALAFRLPPNIAGVSPIFDLRGRTRAGWPPPPCDPRARPPPPRLVLPPRSVTPATSANTKDATRLKP
jgi:hypothetical protein